MLHLLKQKSAVAWKVKERKKYPALKPDLSQIQEKKFDFASELKDLQSQGADEYLKKKGQNKDAEMQSDQGKGKKGNH